MLDLHNPWEDFPLSSWIFTNLLQKFTNPCRDMLSQLFVLLRFPIQFYISNFISEYN
jgi:hypothetical protein